MSGKVALVTGSTKGIGEAIVHRLAEHGAKVVVSSRKADACDKVAADINKAQGKEVAVPIPCNINYKEQLQQLVAGTRQKWGKIDILICNAAPIPISGPQMEDSRRSVRQDRAWARMCVPITGSASSCCPRWSSARTVRSSSCPPSAACAARRCWYAYCISKAADFQLARNIAVEYGPKNIRANCIAPGLIKTDFAKALWDNPDILERSTSGAPLRRIGDPDEIAGAAVFLASKACGAFMTGLRPS